MLFLVWCCLKPLCFYEDMLRRRPRIIIGEVHILPTRGIEVEYTLGKVNVMKILKGKAIVMKYLRKSNVDVNILF